MKKTLAYIASHPLVIALLAGALSVLVLPVLINKYNASVVEFRKFDTKYEFYYINIFGDSTNEMVTLTNYNSLNHGLVKVQHNQNLNYLGIWNLEEQTLKRAPLLFGDYDNNNQKEIWAFSRKEDSLFYYIINPNEDGKYYKKREYITSTQLLSGNKVDIELRSIGEQDINNDGYKEMYFAIDAGFSMTPRRIYAIDPVSGRIYKSPKMGVRFNNDIIMHDLDGNGEKEIVLQTHGSDNYPDTSSFPYNDNSSWLMVLDKNLNFLFEPKEFKGAPSHLKTWLYIQGGKKYLLSNFINREKNKPEGTLALYNTNGKKIIERNLDDIISHKSNFILKGYNRTQWKKIILADRLGNIYFLNQNLELTDKKKLPLKQSGVFVYQDIDNSIPGQEILFPTSSGFLITDNDFNPLARIKSSTDCMGRYTTSIIKQDKKQTLLSANSLYNWFKLSYGINPLYNYRWIIPVSIALMVYILIHSRKKYLKKKKNQKIQKKLRLQEAEKKRLAKDLHDELGSKLTGLRLKIENAKETENLESLDEITRYIHNTHKEIRNIINNLTPPKFRDYDYTSIIEHLVEEYDNHSAINIQLEFFPQENWNGHIPEEIKFHSYRILQEAITNTIKHSEATRSNIQIVKNKNSLYIYVEDNGKGFDENKKMDINQGLGLENIRLRTDLLNGRLNLKSDREGTILEIEFPIKHKS